jgi:uncharacterized lipoprotein
MLEILNLHKRSLATLLAIMALMMLAGCSSTDEAAQEDSSETCPEGSEREWPECLPL